MEICVLHNRWESEDGNHRQYGYALQKRIVCGQAEYWIRCFPEGICQPEAVCPIHRCLAREEQSAFAILYRLAAAHVSPFHLEDMLNDLIA